MGQACTSQHKQVLEGDSGSFNTSTVKQWAFPPAVEAVILASYDSRKLVSDRKQEQ